jgi:hypothetical protein
MTYDQARTPKPLDSTPRDRALAAIARMRREGLSLRQASDLTRTDPRTVRRHAAASLRRTGRRWVPKPYDRLAREMTALTPDGPMEVTVRDSRSATLLAEHANAVRAYIETGDERPLRQLRRRVIRIRGQPVLLETDPVRLDHLAAGGELHYELYRA